MPRKLKGGFSTRAVHVGQDPDPATGAVVPSIYQTSTYAQEDLGVHKGFDYSRAANPTRQNLEVAVASLEGADHGIAFGSGMAALTAIVTHFKAGDHFIVSENVYGGTYRLLTQILARFEVESTWVDASNLDNITTALTPATAAILLETPTNPMMSITDLAGVAKLARERNLVTIVDNTFMSPYFQRPLEFGIDLVFHSTTKYLGGHSDIVGGIVLTSDAGLAEDIAFIQKSAGAIPGPFDCWLTSRSLKTLPLRMERHQSNALQLAAFLEDRSDIEKVYYSGLTSHPQHDLAGTQQRTPDGRPGYGGMLSFEAGSLEKARKFILALEIFVLAESLGGVESLVNHPVTMTHVSVPPEQRAVIGLTESLVRLSVGIEDVADLEDDLAQALAAMT